MKVAVLLGTGRKDNVSQTVANFVVSVLEKHNFNVDLVKPQDYLDKPITARSEKEIPRTKWAEIMDRAQGLVIVTPEYNHGYPGELKLMIDQLYDEYDGKPVMICAVSDGFLGGARAVENLLPVLVTVGLWPLKKGVYFPEADKLFDEKGGIKADEYERRLVDMIEVFRKRLGKLS